MLITHTSLKFNFHFFLGLILTLVFNPLLGQTQIGQDLDGTWSNEYFGASVSSPDRHTVAAGGTGFNINKGRARVYSWYNGTWTQKGYDIVGEQSGERSGCSISMPNANSIAIGAYAHLPAGTVRIHSWNGNSWAQKGSDIDGEAIYDNSGWSVSTPDSNTVAIGAPYNDGNGYLSGHVRVHIWNGSSWAQKGSDIDGEAINDQSGQSVSMPDSNTVAIGAPYNDGNGANSGHVRVYSWNGSSWAQKGSDIDGEAINDQSGWSVSMPNSNTVAIGATGNGSNSGHVRVYSWNGSSWAQKGSDIDGEASTDKSGQSVSMPDSNTVAIGAPFNDGNGSNSGHARVYSWNGSSWAQKKSDIDGEASTDRSGQSVSMSDANHLAIGAPGNNLSKGHMRAYSLSPCPAPVFSALTVDTSQNVTLSWTSSDTSFTVEYRLTGSIDSINAVSVSDTFLTINGLLSNSQYDFFITTNCESNSFVFKTGPFSVTTSCLPLRTGDFESFENVGMSWSENVPPCWTNLKDSNAAGNGAIIKTSGNNYYVLYDGSDSLYEALVSPSIMGLDSGTKQIEFYAMGGQQVYIGTVSNTSSLSTLNIFDTILTSDTNWGKHVTYFTADKGYNMIDEHIAFVSSNATSNTNIMLDDIQIKDKCFPSAISLETTLLDSALISFTSDGIQTYLEYGPPGFVHGTGTSIIVYGPSAWITGLDSATTYDVYVYQMCSDSSLSGAKGPISFSTPCAPKTSPWTADFDLNNVVSNHYYWQSNNLPNDCWLMSISNNVDSIISYPTSPQIYTVDALSIWWPTRIKARINGSDTSAILSPWISNLSHSKDIFSFYARQPFSAINGHIEVITTDMSGNLNTANVVDTFTLTSTSYEKISVFLDSSNTRPSDKRIGFRFYSTSSENYVEIREDISLKPICPERGLIPLSISSDTLFCSGDSVILTAPDTSFFNYTNEDDSLKSYSWSTGLSDKSITVYQTDTITLSIETQRGCILESVPVHVKAYSNPVGLSQITVIGGDSTACEGSMISLSAPSGNYTYLWSNGQTGPYIQATFDDTLSLEVYDTNGCTGAPDYQIVMFNDSPIINIGFSGPSKVCFGDSVQIIPNLLSNNIDSISWHAQSGAIFTTYLDTFYAKNSGYYYAVAYSDSGCTATSNYVNVSISDMSVSYSVVNSLCSNGNNGSISVSISGGIAPYVYSWSNGSTNSTISGLNPGFYQLTVSDSLGCTESSTLQLGFDFQTQPITILGSNASLCYGQTDTLFVSGAFSSINWGGNASGNGDSVFVSSGTTFVSALDTNGCLSGDTVLILSDVPYTTSPEICLVTNDTSSLGLNVIIWERSSKEGVELYNVYRSSVIGYQKIGSKGVNQLSQLTDFTANAASQSYEYYITLVDSCGIEHGSNQNEHSTILLQSSIGTSNEVNLSWNSYSGASILYYVIYRQNAMSNQFIAIDSVNISTTNYIDFAATAGLTKYVISAVLSSPCTSSAKTNSRTMSNVTEEQTISIPQYNLGQMELYPNPANRTIEVSCDEVKSCTAVNAIGQRFMIDIKDRKGDVSSLKSGQYLFIITTESNETVVRKVEIIH